MHVKRRPFAQFLPPTADIFNYIYDTSPSLNGGGQGRLDNVIRFYKSWIVKSVRAVTKYEASVRARSTRCLAPAQAGFSGDVDPRPPRRHDFCFFRPLVKLPDDEVSHLFVP